MRQVIDYNPENYHTYLEMIDFCLRHRDRLSEWQSEFIDTRRKWERWSSGGPTWKMFKKLVETFLNIGGRPINVDIPTDDEVAQILRAMINKKDD